MIRKLAEEPVLTASDSQCLQSLIELAISNLGGKQSLKREEFVAQLKAVPLRVLDFHGLVEVLATLEAMTEMPHTEKLTEIFGGAVDMCKVVDVFYASCSTPASALKGRAMLRTQQSK